MSKGDELRAEADVWRKVNGAPEGRMLVVWSPEECVALKDLVARLARLEGETVDGEVGLARLLEQAYRY
jgi:hypothetical protein